MSENPVRSASVEAAKKWFDFPNASEQRENMRINLALLIETEFTPVVAAAEEAMAEKCAGMADKMKEENRAARKRSPDDDGILQAAEYEVEACAAKIRSIPTGTALAEYVERATKEKEIGITAHIRGGALDGCQCEPCISVREIVERATAELRAEIKRAEQRGFAEGYWHCPHTAPRYRIILTK